MRNNKIIFRTEREGQRNLLFFCQKGRKRMSLNLNYKADVVVDTENLTREEWLDYRRRGIGGSDVAAIMGFSPFCTKRDLYYDKIGVKAAADEEESNWVAKEVGHRLEDLVAEIIFQKNRSDGVSNP